MRDFRLYFLEKESAMGRAVLKLKHGAILAGCCRFNPDEPENEDNLARSLVVQSKHARSKLLGLAAVIQPRNRRCRVFVYRDLKV